MPKPSSTQASASNCADESSALERAMFFRVPFWAVLLLFMTALIAALVMGSIGVNAGRHPPAGRVAKTTVWASDRIEDFRRLADSNPQRAWEQRFPGVRGLQITDPSFTDDGYLLVSRHSTAHKHAVIELIELASGKLVHQWLPDWPAIALATRLGDSAWLPPDGANREVVRRSAALPVMQADGGLWFLNMDGPVVHIDACGRLDKALEGYFHHSFEQDADGNFWVPTVLPEEHPIGGRYRFRNEAITRINTRGEVLFNRSVADLLISSGHGGLLTPLLGVAEIDPLHLNDIQPALTDSANWKKGDLAISLRNLSTVFIYRPSTDRIIWLQTGPWMNQHDVDFLPDGRLSVFGNDIIWKVDRLRTMQNTVYLVDPATGNTTEPFRQAMGEQQVRTRTAGLADVLDNGDVFLEETNYGRLLRLSADGKLRWQYVNRDGQGEVSFVSWSRYVPAAQLPAFESGAIDNCTAGAINPF